MSASQTARLQPLDLIRTGATGLATRRVRSILSALGIAIGIATMVAVLGISSSSQADLLATLDRLGTNLLTVSPGQSFFGEDSALPAESAAMIGRIGPVDDVSATTDVTATVRRTDHIPEEETNGIGVKAVDPSLLSTLGMTMSEGRFLDEATARYPTVVLGSIAAERLGIEDLSGEVSVFIGDRWFTVIGILDAMPLAEGLERSAIVGHEAARTYLDATEDISQIYVRADPDAIEDVSAVLAATANPQAPDEVEIARPSDALAARAAAKDAFTALFLGLGGVALLVGTIGIANVMVISVLERRSEIGLRRAIGATRRHVGLQFLMEAMLLAALGGAAGILLGSLVTAGYAAEQGWPVALPPSVLTGGSVLALVVGAVAGLYPALRAARLSPVEALRS